MLACRSHHDQVLREINDFGMTHLISSSIEEAMAALNDPQKFDPFLRLMLFYQERAAEDVSLLEIDTDRWPDNNGHACQFCELAKVGYDIGEGLRVSLANMRRVCQEIKLLPALN